MYKTMLTVLCAIVLVTACVGQVNFSPSWGKRGAPQDGCKASMDSLMYLYKLVQENIQDKVKQLAHELQEVLECPVCSETMDSTLRQCMNGHGVCRPCARKIDKCPTCKQELALALHKNTLLNQLLDLIPKLCPYAEEGCVSVIVNHEHQTYCEYRPTECKVWSCKWSGCVKDLLQHLKSSHKSIIFNPVLNAKYPGTFAMSPGTTNTFWLPIIYQDQIFWKYVHTKVNRNHVIYHRFYSVPTTKKTCDFYMVISFEKGDLKFECYCKATNLDDKIEPENIESGLIIPVCELNRFLMERPKNTYDYKMKLVRE